MDEYEPDTDDKYQQDGHEDHILEEEVEEFTHFAEVEDEVDDQLASARADEECAELALSQAENAAEEGHLEKSQHD